MAQNVESANLLIVAVLTIRDGQLARFQEFEAKAAGIMLRYGGVIERTVSLFPQSPAGPMRELHLLRFPSQESFAAYRADPELATLSDLRSAAIAHTEILLGRDGPDYTARPGCT